MAPHAVDAQDAFGRRGPEVTVRCPGDRLTTKQIADRLFISTKTADHGSMSGSARAVFVPFGRRNDQQLAATRRSNQQLAKYRR